MRIVCQNNASKDFKHRSVAHGTAEGLAYLPALLTACQTTSEGLASTEIATMHKSAVV